MKNNCTYKSGTEATKTQLKIINLFWQQEITRLSMPKFRKS